MSWLEVLLTVPIYISAVASATLLWLHGSLFAASRARWQAYGGWRAELTRCPLCVSGQFSFWFGILLGAGVFLPGPYDRLAWTILIVCAAPAPALLLYGPASRQLQGGSDGSQGQSREDSTQGTTPPDSA